MARRFLGTLAALTAVGALASCGVETAPEPETRDEMILLAAETLDDTVIPELALLAGEEEEAPVDFDLSSSFGGALGRPTISGGAGTSPSLGSGGPGTPETTGGVGDPSTGVGGVGSPAMIGTGSFATAICDFIAALCDYFGRCSVGIEAEAVSSCFQFAGSQCPAFVASALAESGVTQVPAEAVSWINCATQKIRSQTCTQDDDVFFAAFLECLPASLQVPDQPEPEPQF